MPVFNRPNDGRDSMLGVPGRWTHCTTKPGQKNRLLWFNQRFETETREYKTEYGREWIRAEVRFDDNCGNGQNSFAITASGGDIKNGRRMESSFGGCCHEAIAKRFPELTPLIRFHLYDTRGPMHYVANAVYLAGDRDYNGRRKGEVSATSTRVRFNGVPILHKVKGGLLKRLESHPGPHIVQPIDHKKRPGESYAFGPKFTLRTADGESQFGAEWHEGPFDSYAEAEAFRDAWRDCAREIVTIPTAYSEGKARELDAARRVADWPDATDSELSVEPDQLRAALEARLPKLLAEFESAVRGAGFFWDTDSTVGAPGEWRG